MEIKPGELLFYSYDFDEPSTHRTGVLSLFDNLDKAITMAQYARTEWNKEHPDNIVRRPYIFSTFNVQPLHLLDHVENYNELENNATLIKQLKAQGYDGYCYLERPHYYLTYCIFNPEKMSQPKVMGK